VDKKKNDKSQLAEKLSEDKRANRRDYEDEKAQKKEKLAECRAKIDDLQKRIGEKGKEVMKLANEIEGNKRTLRDKGHEKKSSDSLIERLEEDIETLERSREDQIYKFGDFMPDLVSDIKKYRLENKMKNGVN
jgi:chromosome segregation ATPase